MSILDVIGGDIFYEVAALLVLAAVAGLVGLKLRQPLIVSFIAVGILAGPSVLGIAQSDEQIHLLGELGIAVLLFLVGLKLDLGLVRSLGPVALITGVGQIIATFFAGFLLCLALGIGTNASALIAIALCFSSTIIIVKLLSDKREIDSLHGRIALGVLIVQDIVVVLTMITLSGLSSAAGETSPLMNMVQVFGFGLAMLFGVLLFVRFIANPLVVRLARAPELLLSFAIGWAALLAALGSYFDLGKELGGLLAGISFASTPFREAIAARLSSLRDFLLLFFFVALGASLDLAGLGANIFPALVLSAFVLLGKPLIVLVLVSLQGYHRRTSMLASMTLAQISEFSLIFIAMAVSMGGVDDDALALVTLVALITITISSSVITYSHQLYCWFEPIIDRLMTRPAETFDETVAFEAKHADTIVVGLGRYGLAVAKAMRQGGRHVLGIDFNPVAVRYAQSHGVDALYGDATDPEFVAHLPLANVRCVVSAIPEHEPDVAHDDPRLALLSSLKNAGFDGFIAVGSQSSETAEPLRQAGADLILMPYRDAATQAAELILTERPLNAVEMIDPEGQKELA